VVPGPFLDLQLHPLSLGAARVVPWMACTTMQALTDAAV